MDPITVGLLITSAIGAVATGVSSIANYINTKKTNQQNEDLMREAWSRDDSSRVRMVSDLENAGLSKWLATGASPQTSSPVSLQSPQVGDLGFGDMADALQHAYSNTQQTEMTKAQTETMKKQREAVDKSIAVQEAERQIKEQELRMKTHDANVLESRGDTMSNDPPTLKYIAEALKTLKGDSSRFPGYDDLRDSINKAREEREEKRYQAKVHKQSVKAQKRINLTNEAKTRDKGEKFKPLSYQDWLKMNQLPAGPSTIQSYRSYVQKYY